MKTRAKSEELHKRALKVNPGGVNSAVRDCRHVHISPMIVECGKGDLIWDVDGFEYIDYCNSWGALVLGHCNPKVISAVHARIDKGTTFGIATAEEEEIAQEVVRLVPSVEKVRFVSSGTEATMSALRLARGYTGRDRILKFNGHYHGHCDALLVKPGSGATDLTGETFSSGVPAAVVKATSSLPFNDVAGVRAFLRENADIAAVILEPIAGNMGLVPAKREFLEMLREETTRIGALLIFDEVITGFRASLSGAEGIYGITPDLACFGKIVGGGFPAAAFGGSAEIMDHIAPLGSVYQAGTLSGNPVAMVAGLQTLKILQEPGFYEKLEAKTNRLLDPVKEALAKSSINACLNHLGSAFTLFFGPTKVESQEDLYALDAERFADFYQYLFENGVYFSPSPWEMCNVSIAHTDAHLDYTSKLICDYLKRLG